MRTSSRQYGTGHQGGTGVILGDMIDPKFIPMPFLGALFEPDIEPVIASGFEYHSDEVALHGVKFHGAIDLNVPRSTKILAPTDGYYLATYGEFLTRCEDGKPRLIDGRKVYYGSYMVQGWHTNGRYTQYAHVDWVNPQIRYYSPVTVKDKDGKPTGDLRHNAVLRAPVARYRKRGAASFMRAGEVIGEVGMTGCGLGETCYSAAKFMDDGRPDFRGVNYTQYTEPHLHFVTFAGREPRSRQARLVDPFGIYGQAEDGYPIKLSRWHKRQPQAKHHPLWLPR